MKLVNIGEKIINVGTEILMPGKSMTANKDLCELPAIQAFIAAGMLSTDEGDDDFQKAVEEAARRMVAEKAEADKQGEEGAKVEGDEVAEEAAETAKTEGTTAKGKSRPRAKTDASKDEKSPAGTE